MQVVPYLYHRTGAGIASSRNRSSSGSTAKTACPTASATRHNRRAAGASNGSLPKKTKPRWGNRGSCDFRPPPLGEGRRGRLLAAIGEGRGGGVVAGGVGARDAATAH